MMGAFSTMLLPAFVTDVEKKFHSNKPEKAKTEYGIPPVLTPSILPKKNVKMIIMSSG